MNNESFIREVVDLTNAYRAQFGRAPLSIDLDLMESAQSHAQNMALQDFFSHTGLDGSRSWQRAVDAGYESSYVGENIAAGYQTPQAVVNSWISSSGHRANMLNENYNEIGVGYYYLANDPGAVDSNFYWTQVFGRGEIESTPPQIQIDALQYGASHGDLIRAFGYNLAAFQNHYVNNGQYEGRALDTFDEVSYLAAYDDLLNAFGSNTTVATQHYIQFGYWEGRSPQAFQANQYLASYDDLINVFGNNPAAAAQHYVQHGYWEGRSRDVFDEARYLASNGDLIRAFGYNLEAATQHYIQFGAREHRSKDTFDPVQYLNNYADLRMAFGSDTGLATQHYINHGYWEGRTW